MRAKSAGHIRLNTRCALLTCTLRCILRSYRFAYKKEDLSANAKERCVPEKIACAKRLATR